MMEASRHAGVVQRAHQFAWISSLEVRSSLADTRQIMREADQLARVGFHEQTQRTWLLAR
jgi:hypothetical protein